MSERSTASSVAIVGMAGRFPSAPDVERFWENLCAGLDGVTRFSDEDLARAGVAESLRSDPRYVGARGVIEGADLFDAGFFNVGAREAELTDPQHRVFLECAWEALEAAGLDPARYPGPVGVFAGAAHPSYLVHNLVAARVDQRPLLELVGELAALIGNDKDHLTTRVAYKLGLRGPAITVQSACSTSLVAVALACQSLLAFQCDAALAGGVSLTFPRGEGYLAQEGHILSPDGRCRAFDVSAAGTVPGEGVGVVVLKRLDDALADGDHIHAVILAAALNNDGAAKVGYTAPGVDGQVEVITTAHSLADVDASTIAHVEAHGTGTALGDPIEVEALTRAFAHGGARSFPCFLGSAKAAVGHLNTAAGVTALVKATLAVEHATIPPVCHFTAPNPRLDLARGGFVVPSSRTPWPSAATPRRAGVSAFGFGGTNAHCVLEEAPARERAKAPAWQLLTLSARTETALEAMSARLAARLDAAPTVDLGDVAFTLQQGRRAFQHRRAIVARDVADAVVALRDRSRGRVGAVTDDEVGVAMLFPGQGSQRAGMAASFHRDDAVFREAFERCVNALRVSLAGVVRSALLEDTPESEALLRRTEVAQPALFVMSWSLAQRWIAWGVRPVAMLGHSIGEWVAATLAGVFSLEDAVRLVSARGGLMQSMPVGAMLAVPLAVAEVPLDAALAVAAVNTPSSCVISGSAEAIDALAKTLEARGVATRRLAVERAFHSPSMDAAVSPFEELVRKAARSAPTIPFISNVSGTWITADEAVDPRYWAAQLRATVRFHDGAVALSARARVAVEVGAGATLTSLVTQGRSGLRSVASLGRARDVSDRARLFEALGELWTAGVTVDWREVDRDVARVKTPLPTYPFERRRYFIEAPARADAPTLPAWRDAPVTAPVADRDVWLIATKSPLSESIAEAMRRRGARVTAVDHDDDRVAEALRARGGDAPLVVDLRGLDSLKTATAGVTRLLQSLGRVPPKRAVTLCVAARASVTRSLDGIASLDASALHALVATAPVEYADLRARIVDVDELPDAATLADELLREGDGVVAMRGERRATRPFARDGALARVTWPAGSLLERDAAVRASLNLRSIEDFEDARRALDSLCVTQILELLAASGVALDGGPLTRAALREKTGVLPKFERLLDAWLDALVEAGAARADGDTLFITAERGVDANAKAATIRRDHPEFRGVLDLMVRCAAHHADALRGKVDAIGTLYPNGSSSFVDQCERDTVDVRGEHGAIALACEVVAAMARGRTKPLRILEVGGGRGLLTWPLARALGGTDAELHFTDLGKVFVDDARREARRRGVASRMSFGVLDVSKPADAQGYENRRFDVVVAFNVVHAARDVGAALSNLEALLKPDGTLALVEVVRTHRWDALTWGLAEGWWHYEDRYRTRSPLLSLDAWARCLRDVGFASVERAPLDDARADHGLVVARRSSEGASSAPRNPLDVPIQQLDAEHWVEALATLRSDGGALPSAPCLGGVMGLAARWRAAASASVAVEEVVTVEPVATAHPRPLESAYVAPRTDTERRLCALCEDLLGVSPVGVDDDLVALGADSLIMLRLTDRVQRELGMKVPEGAAFRGMTPAKIAAALDRPEEPPPVDDDPASPLVALQSKGSLPPLFFAHPAAGVVFPYVELARRLGESRPFYALQARGLDGASKPDLTIEAMAERYVAAIRSRQPKGPYHLGGFSFGCLVAYEIACQLSAQGERVALLALLDEPAPVDGHRPAGLNLAWQLGSGIARSIWPHLHDYLYLRDTMLAGEAGDGVRARWRRFLARSVMAGYIPAEHRPMALRQPAIPPMAELFRLHVALTGTYAPRAYAQRVTLLKVTRLGGRNASDPTWGWSMLAAGGVEVIPVPGEHLTVLRMPHVEALAGVLSECLARSAREG